MSNDSTMDTGSSLDFAGWGQAQKIEDLKVGQHEITYLDQEKKHFLSEWKATAICGNDITSSCLYVSALAVVYSGIFAPFVLILVSLTLYLFRKIYAEVGSALPLNGGTYTLLLNTTSKKVAAAAACLTLLSYIATAVISANEAIHYIHSLLPSLPLLPGTVALLGLFAFLSILGVSESANVALAIFAFHILTLGSLILTSFAHMVMDPQILMENIKQGLAAPNWLSSIFVGFCVALLGISGFESSANFIEEQQKGVFPKTLKNMWGAVTILNPTLCFLALGLFSMQEIGENKANLLAKMGGLSFGPSLEKWIGVNAFLVLSGAILTSYVGVTGLVRRMSLDRCMPRFLLTENTWRKTNHWIILSFFLICVSILYITHAEIEALASVYTISFLSVMILFAAGNALLKVKRAKLPRSIKAEWPMVVVAGAIVGIGLLGNLYINPEGGIIFISYYAIVLGFVFFLILRTQILRFILQGTQLSVSLLPTTKSNLSLMIQKMIHYLSANPVIYFTKGDSIAALNRAALYVLQNEQTKNLKIIHVYELDDKIPPAVFDQVKVIDEIYPQLKIDFILIKGTFTPNLIEEISRRFNIEKNHMFIGTPGDHFPHRIENLGGVRVIL